MVTSIPLKSSATEEINAGDRFSFGENWSQFLSTLNEARIEQAEKSLKDMLGIDTLEGKSFLDIGSGSGLFSLAARRLGANVVSFDFDPKSVGCAQTLKKRFFENDSKWKIEQGSALDEAYIQSLGTFDVVYSWGVLHHTGQMWTALSNAAIPTKKEGKLVIAIYNDQGRMSKYWWWVKKVYCSGFVGRMLVTALYVPYFTMIALIKSLLRRENEFATYKRFRGMSISHDWYDWLGGFPFEVASPEAIFQFYKKKGFSLLNLLTTNSSGNNQFVFRRDS